MIIGTPGLIFAQRTPEDFRPLPPLTKDMAAYWPADYGATTDGAIQFTAADKSSLAVASSASHQTGDTDFAWAGWVKLDSKVTTAAIVSKLGVVSNWEFEITYSQSSDRLQFLVSSTGSGVASVSANTLGSPATGVWYFVVAWHDSAGNTINIQINDGSVDSVAHSGGVFVGTSPLRFGARTAASLHFDGRLDSWGFYKRLLTTTEITALYNAGAGLTYDQLSDDLKTDLVSWWDFTARTGAGVWLDSHGGNDLSEEFDASSAATEIKPAAGITAGDSGDYDTVGSLASRIGALTLSQATATARPRKRAIEGASWLQFDGVDDRIAKAEGIPELTRAAPNAVALVFEMTATNSGVLLHNFISGTDIFAIRVLSGSSIQAGFWNGSAYTSKSGAISLNRKTILVMVWDGAAMTLRLNGVEQVGTSGPSTSGSGFCLGARPDGTNAIAGRIAAPIIFTRAPTAAEIASVEAWLGAKYGIVLP